MPHPTVAAATSLERKAAFEQALGEGYGPPGRPGPRGAVVGVVAQRLGLKRPKVQSWLATQSRRAAAGLEHFTPDWNKFRPYVQPAPGSVAAPRELTKARRWLLTAAQDETAVHTGFWENLQAYAAWCGATILVGGGAYNKALFEDHAARTGIFAEAVQPYMAHEPVDLGPVVFCAEMNILPTAVRPLSGLDAYTRGKWGVFPHAKVQLTSVPTITGKPTILMTTGACTVANYIQKKAGQKAEFHHVIGATLVEIDGEGRPFCRQLNASDDGTIQDLDVVVRRGLVTTGNRVEAITWGDLHREKLCPVVAMAAWGFDVQTDSCAPSASSMIDALRPRYQFFHDILDFDARNHHRRADHHHRFQMICQGTDLVQDAVAAVARFLRASEREWCRSVVVESNHDSALLRWLKEAEYREDPANAEFFLDCQREIYAAIRRADPAFNIFRWALERADPRGLEGIDFVPEDGSFVICQAHGGVECGMHGHLGLNGARGSPAAFTKMAMKMNTGHTHSASILDGVYTAGLSGLLEQGYNKGPSSWSQTHTVTYASGKRSLVTMLEGRWRA